MVPCAGARPGACQQATPCAAEPRHRAGIGYDKNPRKDGPSHAACKDWNRPLSGPPCRDFSRHSCMGGGLRPSASASPDRRTEVASDDSTSAIDRLRRPPRGKRTAGDEPAAGANRRRAFTCCCSAAGQRPLHGRSSWAANRQGNARQCSGRRDHEGSNASRDSSGRGRNGSALAQGHRGKARQRKFRACWLTHSGTGGADGR